jgi:antitoxin ParD1/3/4
MPKRTSVTVADHFAEFIERQVDEGRYDSPTDVVQTDLRLLEEQESKLETLRAALIEGEQSGPREPCDFEEFPAEMRRDRASSSE